MKLYTYFENVPEMDPHDGLRLITLWREHWTARGFDPFVLTEWQARQHPYFTEFDTAISALPSVNPKAYERACFVRWLALAQVGGGLMIDYDVFSNPNQPMPQIIVGERAETDALQMFQKRGPCPSFIYASQNMCEWLCYKFATGQYGHVDMDGRDHVSDQYALCQLWTEEEKKPESERNIVLHDLVLGYMDEGWEKAPLIHFSNASMTPRKKQPRWQHIPAILKECQ